MKHISIRRIYFPDFVVGKLYINGDYVCRTLELPDRSNAPNVSCVLEGYYPTKINIHYGESSSYEAYELLDTIGRSDIEIHIGNSVEDTKGCILIGMRVDWLNSRVLDSRKAFDRFMKLMNRDEGFVTIKEDIGVRPKPRIKETLKQTIKQLPDHEQLDLIMDNYFNFVSRVVYVTLKAVRRGIAQYNSEKNWWEKWGKRVLRVVESLIIIFAK